MILVTVNLFVDIKYNWSRQNGHTWNSQYKNMNAIVSYRVSYLGNAILLKLDNMITICSLI